MDGKRRFALVSPATQAFIEEARRTPNYTLKNWIHGYVYARWPYLYIGIGKGDHWLARWLTPLTRLYTHILPAREQSKSGNSSGTFADGYHGKVLPLENATRLIQVNEDIRVNDLEQIIPYPKARDIILKNPQHIVVLECPCRSAKENPCLPLDVCLIVGEPMAGFIRQHHAKRSRDISVEEAEQILAAEHARGHVHHAFFKDAMLGRYYAICNCCSCCCGAMHFHQSGVPMLASSGYVCQVNELNCIGCETCADKCPFDALQLVDDVMSVKSEDCMGCGVCMQHCDQNALCLERNSTRGEALDIQELLAQAVER